MKRLTKIERNLYKLSKREFRNIDPEDFLKEIKKGNIEKALLVIYPFANVGRNEDYIYIDKNGNKCRVNIYVIDDEGWNWSSSNWKPGDKTVQGIDIQKALEIKELSKKRREEITTPEKNNYLNWFEFGIHIYRVYF